VVYTPKSLAIPRHSSVDWLSELEPIIPPQPLSHDEKQALLMFARRYPLLGKARANEIAGIYAESLRDQAAPENSSAPESPCPVSDAGYLLGIARKLSGSSAANAGKDA